MFTLRSFLSASLLCASLVSVGLACGGASEQSRIQIQLTEEQWVNTETANVVVSVTAALPSSDLAGFQKKITQDLNSIYAGEWRITQFAQDQDASGLQRANIEAQLRMPEAEISGLRDKAKAVSKPGEAFSIVNVDYLPSFAELNAARAALRQKIYHDALLELDVVNKTYAPSHYVLSELTMLGLPLFSVSQSTSNMPGIRMMAKMVNIADTEPVVNQVSQRLEASANVTFMASTEEPESEANKG